MSDMQAETQLARLKEIKKAARLPWGQAHVHEKNSVVGLYSWLMAYDITSYVTKIWLCHAFE